MMKLSRIAMTLVLMGLSSQATASSVDGLLMKPARGTPLGVVINNPYENAPLTALVSLHGHNINDVTVKVHARNNGVPIEYPVSDTKVMEDGGVPIFGLYPDHLNTVTIDWTEAGEKKTFDYKILTPDIDMGFGQGMWAKAPITDVHYVADDFKDRLYFLSWNSKDAKNAQIAHNNNTAPGALAWDATPGFFIIDTAGEIRWYLNPYTTHDPEYLNGAGYPMGMNVTKDGDMIWVQGQGWKHMSIMGKMLGDRLLPGDFQDGSHEAIEAANGNYFIRAARKNYRNDKGLLVNSVRDHIIELDKNGKLVDFWDLNQILDNQRDAALLSLDSGAVCLNVDLDKAGHKVSAEDLADAPYGDIPGVGAGRNWAHVNSVDYDAKDDSIVLSSRHQSAVIKIGRDKKVKWILSASEGWSEKYQDKLLTPVDAKGNKLNCSSKGECKDTNFDFTWTQHTAYVVPQKGTITVFDNGDGRYLEQPAIPMAKYSRSVEYKVNDKDMTVQQVWEYGKEELGYEGYSPITSIVKYQEDKDSMMSYYASSGLFGAGGGLGNVKWDDTTGKTKSILVEHRYGETKPAVRIDVDSNQIFKTGYRAQVIKIADMMK
ncbi:aryl-sulfate sulfotransferase [Shewanella youngdeokensis]|uniref:Aryl-sulfate sulfotransferase n=1 Tax=Shewanella youngdeokensis TaxID=2999068 RepID=A0ABZ0K4J5_9GAMM|nr:aryl-sulfate sulfotransferase [Shewanella sp. DAU334]